MILKAEIKKWGNSPALRLSGAMGELPGLKVGTRVDVEVSGDGLIIRKAKTDKSIPFFSEAVLLADMTPERAHADALATPTVKETGL